MKRVTLVVSTLALAAWLGCDQPQGPTTPESNLNPGTAAQIAGDKNDAAEMAQLEAIKAKIAAYRAEQQAMLLAKSKPNQTEATRTVPGQYPTIQAAVNASSPGDVIAVSPKGTPYEEQVIVAVPRLRILGQGATRVPVRGGFIVDANRVEIANFNIAANGGEGVAVMAVAGANINHNTIAGGINGISLNGSSGCEVIANTCNGNGDGIDVNAGATGNHIEVNFCQQNADDGIDLDASHDNELHDNICSQNTSDGVEMTDCNTNTFVELFANNNGGRGCFVAGTSTGNNFAADITVKKNGNWGFHFAAGTSNNRVKNSTIAFNTPCDIEDLGTGNRFKNNTVGCTTAK